MLFKKENKTAKPYVPFCSKEYEIRISKLTKKEYEFFKNALFGYKLNEYREKEIKVLYKKLDVTSQIELMAKYGQNYFHEMKGDFSRK